MEAEECTDGRKIQYRIVSEWGTLSQHYKYPSTLLVGVDCHDENIPTPKHFLVLRRPCCPLPIPSWRERTTLQVSHQSCLGSYFYDTKRSSCPHGKGYPFLLFAMGLPLPPNLVLHALGLTTVTPLLLPLHPPSIVFLSAEKHLLTIADECHYNWWMKEAMKIVTMWVTRRISTFGRALEPTRLPWSCIYPVEILLTISRPCTIIKDQRRWSWAPLQASYKLQFVDRCKVQQRPLEAPQHVTEVLPSLSCGTIRRQYGQISTGKAKDSRLHPPWYQSSPQ